MKTAPRLALSVAVATLALGCAPRKAPPFDAERFPVGKELPPLGAGGDLLRAEILLPEKLYRVGDRLEVRVRVTNTSSKPVVIARKIDGVYFCGRRIPLYALRVTDRRGRPVKLLPVIFFDMYKDPITPEHRLRLAPGRSHTEKFALYERRLTEGKLDHESGYDLNRPGRYRLWFHFASMPSSTWSLGSAQLEAEYMDERWRRRLEKEWPSTWLKELVRCHIAAEPVVLRALPGTPREALEKWKPPPRPKPIKPEVLFGRRYVPAGFIEKGNPVPKAIREKLERELTIEFSAKDTLGKAVEYLKPFLPLAADAGAARVKLGTRLHLARGPVGDVLYWLARLTETSLVLRGSELVFVKKVPASGAVAVCEHYLPAKRLYPGDEHPAVYGLSKEVYLEFKDLTAGEALKYLAGISDVGITTAPGVAGKKLKTIKMEDVSIKKVLDAVVAAVGCDYEVRRGLIYVYPKKAPAGPPKK